LIPIRQIQKATETDDELLLLFKESNDQQALATLYLRYNDLVYGTCLKYLKDGETAKDAVMNIYTELLQKLPAQEVHNFKSWLYVVVKNHCLMQLRREKNTTVVEFQPAVMQSADLLHLDDLLDKEAQFKILEQCMERLSDEQRKAIHLFYFEDKCYNEIAEQTAMDWNKIRSLIQNGRRNLKICMDQHG
jgi:RNA polymerase sigma factor (sigma-70 family)